MTRINLLSNPSFEVDTAGWTGTVTRSTGAQWYDQGYAGLYKIAGSMSLLSAKVPATAGLDYTASGWFLDINSNTRTSGVGVRFYDASNVELSPPTITLTATGSTLTHVRRSMTRTAPAGTTQVALQIQTNTTNTGLRYDAFLLEQSSTVGDYFDGSTVKEGFTYSWSGTAHASSSTETAAAVSISSSFTGSGTLSTALTNYKRISTAYSGVGTLATALTNYRRISAAFSGSGALTTAVAVPRHNLFTHPSAEGVGITWSVALGNNSVTRTTEQAWVGTEAYKVTGLSVEAQEIRTPSGTAGFPVVAGYPYALSFQSRAAVTDTSITPRLVWYNAAGAELSVSSLPAVANDNWRWLPHSGVATAPALAAYVAVQLRFNIVTGDVQYLDGFLLEQSSTVKPYFDGSSVASGYDYSWKGAPNASISTEMLGTFTGYDSRFAGSGSLAAALSNYKRISSAYSGAGVLTTLVVPAEHETTINSAFSGSGTLETAGFPAPAAPGIVSGYSGEGVLYSELFYTRPPAELGSAPLGKLVSFNVSTSAVPLNPAEGSGATPSVSSSYIKGRDAEFALGENSTLTHGAVGTYEGEIVRLSLPEGSDVAAVSQDTALTLLNNEMSLFPFIDAAPSVWTAARAIEYWTQQCGLFYDKVPGDCIAYASGYGHTDSYGAQNTARFYEKLVGGTTATTLHNGRSVKTLGSAVTGTTAFHELPKGNVAVSVPAHRKLVASIGLGLRGTGRTATVNWSMIDSRERPHNVTLTATSAGLITASIGGVPVVSGTVAGNADYRVSFSIERTSDTSVVGKLIIHTDDLAGTGSLVFESATTGVSYALPAVTYLTSITHASAGGSGAEMLRWGTYLAVAQGHPRVLPAVQKALSPTAKEFGFVSGFEGNVWSLLNEYCAITRQDISFLNSQMTLTPRIAGLSVPTGNFGKFSRDSERREKYKQVAVVNKQSKAVNTNDAILWRADSVFQVAAREVFETTVQTGHSILSLVQPVPVEGILPFPYVQGGGQYVVTGADGYIIAPAWWNDNGGKVEVYLTGKDGEIALKITAPTLDSVRAPYRISEGEADRPALYVAGSGILNDPKEVHVGTGASNAKEGFDNVFESPFIAGVMETYDTAAAMAAEYSASVAEVSFELPNDFYTPSRFGQYPAGTRFTDGKRNYRITDASQTHSKVSANAVPHTTIGDYVASYPAGATLADEKARHAGRTIKQFNISPLRGTDD